jgi:hypothetical protein
MKYADLHLQLRPNEHRLYPEITAIVTALSAVVIASQAVLFKKIPDVPGHMNARCQSIDVQIRIPIGALAIEFAIDSRMPDCVEIQFQKREQLDQVIYQNETSKGFRSVQHNRLLDSAVFPTYVQFFEDRKLWIESSYGSNTYNWPSVWNFGRVIRNAISHRNALDFRNQNAPPVTWYNLSYSAADHGKKLFETDFSIADVIVLMFEMNDALDVTGCPLN